MSDSVPPPPEGEFGSGRGTPPGPPAGGDAIGAEGTSLPPWLQPKSSAPMPYLENRPPPPPPPPPTGRRRHGVVVTVVAIALIPLVVLGIVLLRANRGSSVGAADPQGAVTNLAGAINRQDVLGALTAIAPEESAAATSLVKALISKGQSQGLIADGSNPLQGVISGVKGLQLSVRQLHPLVARVDVTGGVISYSFDPTRLSETLRKDLGPLQPHTGSLSTAQVQAKVNDYNRDHSHHLSGAYIMTVKRNGRWFVSPFYTIAEYLREAAGLPAPDYDATVKGPLSAGAVSPEEVVRKIFSQAVSSTDPTRALTFLPPDTFRVVYDYLDSIKAGVDRLNQEADKPAGFFPHLALDVTDLRLSTQPTGATETQVNLEGLTATLTSSSKIPADFCSGSSSVSSSGTEDNGGGFFQVCPRPGRPGAKTYTVSTKFTFTLNGTCYTARGSVTSNLPTFAPPPGHDTSSGCLSKVAPGLKLNSFFVMTVFERGGWYLDPLGTAAGYVRLIIQQATPADVECFLRQSHDHDRHEAATQHACDRSTMFTR